MRRPWRLPRPRPLAPAGAGPGQCAFCEPPSPEERRRQDIRAGLMFVCTDPASQVVMVAVPGGAVRITVCARHEQVLRAGLPGAKEEPG